MSDEPSRATPWRIGADEFTRIYDPSVGEDEAWYLNDHTFFRDHDGQWHVIGITHAEPMFPHDEQHLAHATAGALSGPWTKRPFALSADRAAGETVLWAPHVIEHEGQFWMFVCAGGEDPTAFRIVLATSADGTVWTRHPSSPVIVDGFEARDPMVLRVGDRWIMYYTATEEPSGGRHVVAAASSPDLVTWGDRRIVYRDEMSGTGGGPTESPFVVERDGRFMMLIGPDWRGMMDALRETGVFDPATYRRTRVLVSDDPLAFDAQHQVGEIEAHAAEVVIDEAGAAWVSHCGWGQGGLYLARAAVFDL